MVDKNRSFFGIPEEKKLRVIFDSDVKNEVDDQFAIVHALLTESFDIRGIIPTHFGKEKSPHSQKDSEEEVRLLLQKMKLKDCVKIVGANIKVLWIGGLHTLKGGAEPNLKCDVKAAQIVFDSQIELWQIPRDVYSMLPVSFAEMYVKVHPYGEIGKYLSENVVAFNNSGMRKPAEYRVLGDSPVIGILLNENCGKWTIEQAPIINNDMSCQKRKAERKIRVYESIDTRFILEDFYAKLQLFAERG